MRKFFKKLYLLLPTLVMIAVVIATYYVLFKVTIKWLNEKALASQGVITRELTEIETYKTTLYKLLGYNYKDYKTFNSIIKCESNWNATAYNYKSHDTGLMQINIATWDKEADRLGLENYHDYWLDNLKLGVHIYKNYGPTQWVCYKGKY